MTTYFANGSPTTDLTENELRDALAAVLSQLGPLERVLAIPPDHTRDKSFAGPLTCMLHEQLGEGLTDVMPALGTHFAMTDEELTRMFPIAPKGADTRTRLAERRAHHR